MILVALRQCPLFWADHPILDDYTLMACQDTSYIYIHHNILNDPQAVGCLLKLGIQNVGFESIPQDLVTEYTYLELSNMAQSVSVSNRL
jgi:hypothetical protein